MQTNNPKVVRIHFRKATAKPWLDFSAIFLSCNSKQV